MGVNFICRKGDVLVEVDGTALANAAEEQSGEGLYEALRRCLDRARWDLNLNALSCATIALKQNGCVCLRAAGWESVALGSGSTLK